MRISLLFIIISIISFVLAFLFLPETVFHKNNINYLTGFRSFYSAGIFPTIALLMGHIGSLNVKHLSPAEVSERCREVRLALTNLFFILFSIMLFIFIIFIHSCMNNSSFWSIEHVFRAVSVVPFILATYGSVFWLRGTINILFRRIEQLKKMEVRNLEKNIDQ